MYQLAMMSTTESEKAGKSASDQAGQALQSLRLLTSLGRTRETLATYLVTVMAPMQSTMRTNFKISIASLFSEFSKFAAFALAFYYGSVVVDEDTCSFSHMFSALNAVVFSAIVMGTYLSMLPKAKDAEIGARNMRAIIESLEVSRVHRSRFARARARARGGVCVGVCVFWRRLCCILSLIFLSAACCCQCVAASQNHCWSHLVPRRELCVPLAAGRADPGALQPGPAGRQERRLCGHVGFGQVDHPAAAAAHVRPQRWPGAGVGVGVCVSGCQCVAVGGCQCVCVCEGDEMVL
jgi:hypothetical protein